MLAVVCVITVWISVPSGNEQTRKELLTPMAADSGGSKAATAANGSIDVESIDATVRLSGTLSAVDKKTWEMRSAGDAFRIRSINDAEDVFTDRIVLNSLGYVGIGTTSPSANLQVLAPRYLSSFSDYGSVMLTQTINAATDNNSGAGVASMEPILTLNRHGAQNVKYDPFADFSIGSYQMSGTSPRTRIDLRLMHDTDSMSRIMTWESSGNVGIGTTSPVADLHINAASGTTMFIDTIDAGLGETNIDFGAEGGTVIGRIRTSRDSENGG